MVSCAMRRRRCDDTAACPTRDRFLLCTDGVHGQMDLDQLTALASLSSCEEAVEALLAQARAAGGRDNATAVLVAFAQGGV